MYLQVIRFIFVVVAQIFVEHKMRFDFFNVVHALDGHEHNLGRQVEYNVCVKSEIMFDVIYVVGVGLGVPVRRQNKIV